MIVLILLYLIVSIRLYTQAWFNDEPDAVSSNQQSIQKAGRAPRFLGALGSYPGPGPRTQTRVRTEVQGRTEWPAAACRPISNPSLSATPRLLVPQASFIHRAPRKGKAPACHTGPADQRRVGRRRPATRRMRPAARRFIAATATPVSRQFRADCGGRAGGAGPAAGDDTGGGGGAAPPPAGSGLPRVYPARGGGGGGGGGGTERGEVGRGRAVRANG